MSLFGSLNTAISGLTAQSRSLDHISGNIANSQTTGYKRLDTSFADVVASLGGGRYSGGVMASGEGTTDVQGTVTQADNPLALALNGRGFFSVARPVASTAAGVVNFDQREMFTRAGDFQLDARGFLVNGSGDVLQGWVADANGVVDNARLQPIRADRAGPAPAATTELAIAANLPATGESNTGTTEAQVYDSLGNLQTLELGWTRGADANTWALEIRQPGDAGATVLGNFEVEFGTNGASPGTIGAVRDSTGATVGTYQAGTSAQALTNFTANFGGLDHAMSLDLGRYGSTEGLTQYAGSSYELRSLAQNGAPAGAFASLAMQEDGRVVVSYDNGQSRTIAQVPVVTFPDPDQLERLNGQAFALTGGAGRQQIVAAGRSGAATLQTSAVEGSNVDVAGEFAKLIVAQRAYSANTKIVTTSDEMLQETINLKR